MIKGSKRFAMAIAVLIFIALVVPPFINISRYRGRIAESMSRAVGRPVTFGSISLRVLPQPGFDFENLVIGDDPSFSAEPILRADEVTAYLRLASLWRGRMEIARLQLSYPSLNFVHRADGEWNVESLLYQASQTPSAPTTAMRPEARPRFPYIEAQDGRINFKYGLEKEVFSFTEAKFALWSPAQDQWRMRLQAKPVRTDTVVFDTGVLRAEGSFKRAQQLRDTPLTLRVSLERGQLGQLTRLAYGRDRGWRGALGFTVRMSGTPANLEFEADAAVQDFRRYDITRGEAIRLETHCTGKFSSATSAVENMRCRVPADKGQIIVDAALAGWGPRTYRIALSAESLPMNWVVAMARHTKRDLPDDLTGTGTVNAAFELQRPAANARQTLVGNATTTNFSLRSAVLQQELTLGKIEFQANPNQSNGPRIDIQPFAVPLGLATPAAANGWITNTAYRVSVVGDGEASQMLRLARTFGIGAPKFQLRGSAHINAQVGGEWKGFPQPETSGAMQVKNITAEIPGVNAPVKIASADISFQNNSVLLRKLVASADTLKITGTATFPRHCEDDQFCASQVDVQFDELDLDRANALLNPRMKKRPWYRLFGANDERSVLATWRASGHISAKRLIAKALSTGKLSTEFALNSGKLRLKHLQGDVFGGTQTSDWNIDFTGDSPTYEVSGDFNKVAVAQLAALTRDAWGTGTLGGVYQVKMSGWSAGDLINSAVANCDFNWRDGTLRHLSLDGKTAPLHFPSWTGKCNWSSDGFRVIESKLQAAGSIYTVSGSVQPSRNLRLDFVRGDGTAYQVTGTLEKPQVAAAKAGRTAEAKLQQ